MASVPIVMANIATGALARLDLKPGDKLVLHCDWLMNQEDRVRAKAYIEAAVPGHECLVLPKGWQLGVISQENGQTKFREFL